MCLGFCKSARNNFPSVRPLLRLPSLLSLDLSPQLTWLADREVHLPRGVVAAESCGRTRCRIGSWFGCHGAVGLREELLCRGSSSPMLYLLLELTSCFLVTVGVDCSRARGRCLDEDVAMVAC